MCTRSIRSVIPFITTDLCSLDGAQVPDASVASDSSAARRVSSPRTSGEFRVSSPVLGSGEHSVTSRGSLEQEIEASEGSQFWADNQIVIQAKEAVALLKRLRGRIRGQSRGRGGRLSANSLLSNFSDSPAFAGELRNASLHGGRSSLCRSAISDGLRQRRSEHSVRHSSSDSEWDKMLESLSRQELLKLLVRLRMRRIVSRSRLTSCMGHVSDAAQSGEDVRTIQNLLGRAWVHEEDIKKHSRRINKILHLLGLLEGALPPEPTYFSKNLLFSPYLIHPPHEVADDEDLVYVPVPVGSGYADSLRTSLEGESTGYVVFYDEIIPIARRVPHSFYNSSAVEGRPWGELDSGRSKRRIIPSFGSVMEYGGVQLGRPLVSMSDSEYTLWKLESYVLDDSVPTVSLRGQESARGGNMNSSVCSRNTRVSQVVLRSDILPLARSHTPAPAQLQFRWHPKIIEGLSPIFHSPPPHSRANDGVRSPVMTSNASRASVGSAHSTFPVANPQAPHRLLPLTCSSSPRLQQPCALQPNRDTRDLMSIQSLSTQQKRDEAQGQTSQPSSRVTEALSRLDEMRQERERMAANLRERRSPTTQIANQDSELRRRTETFMRFRLPTMANPEHANRNDEGGKGEDHKTR
ncbi:hypothetical protein, conserved [Trypanosoma vivax Y486]|uniref:Uncharacterized protein n=1 Tax=Trypanosoma vivax (strain Y486) TaxID=1055687 RepID=F9WKS6_TRYVY|nr:hypothetical protein, conserved [Trypanosoma vivax Y486]|eukprot:CCD18101.1 hypothetical protein, conserved [Trypanosoma vivax Y486]